MRAPVCASLVLSGLAGSGACAHAEPFPPPKEQPGAEVILLQERVRRLEKRLSDVDAQVALLTERVQSRGPSAVAARPAARYASSPDPVPPRHVYESPSRAFDLSPPESISSGAPASLYDDDRVPTLYEPMDDEGDPGPAIEEGALAPAGPPADVEAGYSWAHARLKEGRYLEAVAAFEGILERHRDHHLADNALYWTAICHERRGEPRLAIEAFQKLPMVFPESPKLPDALFGMASAHEGLGEPVLAETLYTQLVQQYPKAEKAPEARRALRRLQAP